MRKQYIKICWLHQLLSIHLVRFPKSHDPIERVFRKCSGFRTDSGLVLYSLYSERKGEEAKRQEIIRDQGHSESGLVG